MKDDTIRQRLGELAGGKDHEFLASEIFAAQLNYPVALAPLPRQKWNPEVAGAVKDACVLNAAGDFKIIYCQIDGYCGEVSGPLSNKSPAGTRRIS